MIGLPLMVDPLICVIKENNNSHHTYEPFMDPRQCVHSLDSCYVPIAGKVTSSCQRSHTYGKLPAPCKALKNREWI